MTIPTLLGLALTAAAPAQAERRCPILHDAGKVALWVLHGERLTAVEGSERSAAVRGDREWGHLFFEVALVADRPGARCLTLGWRIEPIGAHPIDARDFGGTLPSGTITLTSDSDHGEPPEGEIELWVPDDSIAELEESFRIVLVDASTGRPLAGAIGRHDDRTGLRDRHAPAAALDMHRRLIMQVRDAPEQRARR